MEDYTNVHVYPLNDSFIHVVDNSGPCLCGPTVKDGVTIHHSLDGREFSEPDYEGSPMPVEE